jgi:hypothetical protein
MDLGILSCEKKLHFTQQRMVKKTLQELKHNKAENVTVRMGLDSVCCSKVLINKPVYAVLVHIR